MDRIKGYVEKVFWSDPETGSVLASVRYGALDGGMEAGKIRGRYKGLAEGDFFEASGEWKTQQNKRSKSLEEIFNARSIKPSLPHTPASAKDWLAQIFKGDRHGVTAESIAAFVGADGRTAITAAERTPEKILSISTNPAAYRAALLETWGRRISGRKAVTLMEGAGIEESAIAAVIDAYRDSAFDVLRANPFVAAKVDAFGFGNADKIATRLGIAKEDDRRIIAAFLECIEIKRGEGDTFVSLSFVADMLSADFGISPTKVSEFVVANARNPDLPFVLDRRPDGRIITMNRDLVFAEGLAARKVVEMLARPRKVTVEHAADIVEDILSSKGKKFDDIQKAAVATCVSEPFSILTGGPGTGKSTVTEIIVEAAVRCGESRICLAAPTGKAATRIAETTGREASTVHSLLEAAQSEDGVNTYFKRNKDNQLPGDAFVIIDEASMLDAMTMKALMEALPATAKLLLVGDPNQLPSVDAGSVLLDLLGAEKNDRLIVPRAELINVYRQDPRSRIAIGAAQIKDGEIPSLTNRYEGGLVLYEHKSDEVVKRVEWIVKMLIEKRYVVEDIVVLSPQSKGTAGTWEINTSLSKIFNPNGQIIPGVFRGPTDDPLMPVPRVGDRVMLTENEPKNGVMNGDTGVIARCFEKDTGVSKRPFFSVAYDCGKTAEYPATQWRRLIMAYAVTIHKSQGSQYQNVIMPVVPEHERMLDRSILYTGWTRTKTSLFLVGERETIDAAVDNVEKAKRSTRLAEFVAKISTEMNVEARYEKPIKKIEDKQETTPVVPKEAAMAPAIAAAPIAPRPVKKPIGFSLNPAARTPPVIPDRPVAAAKPATRPGGGFQLKIGEPKVEPVETPGPRF